VAHQYRQTAVVHSDGVPEPGGVDVRQIDKDSARVQLLNGPKTALRETAAGAEAQRRTRPAEGRRRQMDQRDEDDRTGIETVKDLQIGIEGICALNPEKGCVLARGARRSVVAGCLAQGYPWRRSQEGRQVAHVPFERAQAAASRAQGIGSHDPKRTGDASVDQSRKIDVS
jgi:hypothetical protein